MRLVAAVAAALLPLTADPRVSFRWPWRRGGPAPTCWRGPYRTPRACAIEGLAMAPLAGPSYLTGIDVGSATCSCALLRADKTPVGKPTTFANTAAGFAQLTAK